MNWGQILSSLNDGGSVRLAYKFPKYEQDIFYIAYLFIDIG